MPRKAKDQKLLDTATSRLKLTPCDKPYFCRIAPDTHLGYRRLKDRDGSWTLRRRVDDKYVTEAIGFADDYSPAGGNTLTFDQAVDTARTRSLVTVTKAIAPFTVCEAVELYLKDIEDDGDRDAATIAAIRRSLERTVLPVLGKVPCAKLTTEQLTKWRQAIVTAPALGRGGHPRRISDPEDAKRARRATATRLWTAFKAVLNHAFFKKRVASNLEWKAVKALKSIDKARDRALTVSEGQRLINFTDPEFKPMVQGGLLTGGRYGSLVRLRVRDFNPDAGIVQMTTRKGGRLRTYYTHLTEEGRQFFRVQCAGRKGSDLIFTRCDGAAWGKSNQETFMSEASERAGIEPRATYYTLRHTYISLSVMAGMSFADVAANVGTSVRMIESHYAHLAPRHRSEQVSKFAPTFGIDPGNVTALR